MKIILLLLLSVSCFGQESLYIDTTGTAHGRYYIYQSRAIEIPYTLSFEEEMIMTKQEQDSLLFHNFKKLLPKTYVVIPQKETILIKDRKHPIVYIEK